MFYARVAKKERERPIRKLVYVKYHMFTIHVHACIRGNGVANGALGSWDFPKRFPRIAFSRRAARSDSSLVFRRDFIVEKSAFKRGRLQVATASRTRSPDGTRVHVCVRACIRKCHETLRYYFYFFFSFIWLKRENRIRVRVPSHRTRDDSRKEIPYSQEIEIRNKTRYFRVFAKASRWNGDQRRVKEGNWYETLLPRIFHGLSLWRKMSLWRIYIYIYIHVLNKRFNLQFLVIFNNF